MIKSFNDEWQLCREKDEYIIEMFEKCPMIEIFAGGCVTSGFISKSEVTHLFLLNRYDKTADYCGSVYHLFTYDIMKAATLSFSGAFDYMERVNAREDDGCIAILGGKLER